MIIIDGEIVSTRTCTFLRLYPYHIIQCGQFSAYYQPAKTLYFVYSGKLNAYNLSSFLSGTITSQQVSVGSYGFDVYVIQVDANFVYLLQMNYPGSTILKYNRSTLLYNGQITLPAYSVTSGNIIHDFCGTGFIITDTKTISVTNGNIETFTWFKAISYNPVLDVCLVKDDDNNYYIAHNFINGQRRFVKLTFSNANSQYNLELVPSNTQILLKMWQDPSFWNSLFYKHNPLPINSEQGKIKLFAYNEISETTADVVPLER